MAARKKVPAWRRLAVWTGQTLTKVTPRIAGAFLVGAVAFYISFGHIRHTAILAGQTADVASLTPLAVDGLLIVAGTYAMAGKVTTATRLLAYLFFLLAWAASLYANIQSAGPGAPVGNQIIAAWPAIATLGTAILLHMGTHKPKPKARPKVSAPAVPVPVSPPPAGSNGHSTYPTLDAAEWPLPTGSVYGTPR